MQLVQQDRYQLTSDWRQPACCYAAIFNREQIDAMIGQRFYHTFCLLMYLLVQSPPDVLWGSLFILRLTSTPPPFVSRSAQPGSAQTFSMLADPIVSSDSSSCIIPFSRAGNLIIIKAKADTIEGNFILDTGAPHLVLNMTYFRDYPAEYGPAGDDGGITGSASSSSPTSVKHFSFGPINYHRVEADRINLGHIENSKGIKILGLIGLQLLKNFEMIIDYEKNLIYLHLIKRKEKSIPFHHPLLSDTSLYTTSPIDIMEDKLLTYGRIGGKKLTFVIDTGAESNIMDSRLPNKILENISITRRVILSGTGNKKVEALYGNMKDIKIGNQAAISLPVVVTNLEKMCYSYNKCIDAMLGFEFLSLQKIGFNFVTRKMFIWK